MFDVVSLVQLGGYVGIFLILFAETGLFIGFFLPGDSLLFAAGFLASQGYLNIWLLVPLALGAAILGNAVGYWLGRKLGPLIFSRKNSLIFSQENVIRSQKFYEHHGGKALILARFVPIIRTFVPILAGVGGMDIRKFQQYNIMGGVIWTAGITLLGYFLGRTVPNIDQYILPVIIAIVLVSVLPGMIHILRNREERRRILTWLKERIGRTI